MFGLPDLDSSNLSDEEGSAVFRLHSSLNALPNYIKDFEAALQLFDFCEVQYALIAQRRNAQALLEHDEANRDVFSAWCSLAARDGAMTIFHFGKAMEGIKASIRTCPSVEAKMDRSLLRSATNLFRTSFPNFEAVRHGVAHAAELDRDEKARKANAHNGTYETEHIKIGVHVEGLTIRTLIGRTFTVTVNQKIVSYDLTTNTLGQLEAVKSEFFLAFKPACQKPWSERFGQLRD